MYGENFESVRLIDLPYKRRVCSRTGFCGSLYYSVLT